MLLLSAYLAAFLWSQVWLAHALGAPPAALFRMELSSACFSRISYTGGEPSVRLLNDTSHLAVAGPDLVRA